ncbi:hypothetical protein HK100_002125 [Physocladia obscura]|uniref:Uncharacterized protein n=1 Tax=Physocladia obscura TaxID=109957 RepID=A0AAD5T1U0_9FUNG|nr:hypothetical protein HK100_002125 [Physocladia obscura]
MEMTVKQQHEGEVRIETKSEISSASTYDAIVNESEFENLLCENESKESTVAPLAGEPEYFPRAPGLPKIRMRSLSTSDIIVDDGDADDDVFSAEDEARVPVVKENITNVNQQILQQNNYTSINNSNINNNNNIISLSNFALSSSSSSESLAAGGGQQVAQSLLDLLLDQHKHPTQPLFIPSPKQSHEDTTHIVLQQQFPATSPISTPTATYSMNLSPNTDSPLRVTHSHASSSVSGTTPTQVSYQKLSTEISQSTEPPLTHSLSTLTLPTSNISKQLNLQNQQNQQPQLHISTIPNIAKTHIFDYFRGQLVSSEYLHDLGVDAVTGVDAKKERIENFLSVPWEFEKLMLLGYLICLDSFLYVFTILPARIIIALFTVANSAFSDMPNSEATTVETAMRKKRLTTSQKCDLMKGLLVGICCYMLENVDGSRLYHSVRGQSTVKLYVIFNCLEICDKLCSAFGHDILDSLFSKTTIDSGLPFRRINRVSHFLLALCYIFLHSMVLFYEVMALNVAINSYNNALLSLLLSNQFVEIKGSVFKKFERENLFQLSCAVPFFKGAAMRLQSLPQTVHAFTHAPLSPNAHAVLQALVYPAIAILGTEFLVDWLKHAFITKFNQLKVSVVYRKYRETLCRDLVVTRSSVGDDGSSSSGGVVVEGVEIGYVDKSPSVARRIGFVSVPLACLVIRVALQTARMVCVGGECGGAAWNAARSIPMPEALAGVLGRVGACFTSGEDAGIGECLGRVLKAAYFDRESWRWVAVRVGVFGSAVGVIAGTYVVLFAVKLFVGYNLIKIAQHRVQQQQISDNIVTTAPLPPSTPTQSVPQSQTAAPTMNRNRRGSTASFTDSKKTGVGELAKGLGLPIVPAFTGTTASADDGYGTNYPIPPSNGPDEKLDRVDRFAMVKSRIV